MIHEKWKEALTNNPEPATLAAYSDWLDEQGHDEWAIHAKSLHEGENDMMSFPGKKGEHWLIKTVTLYYVGEITEVGPGYVRMKNASWVHWTGRISVLTKVRSFQSSEFGERSPRCEYVGNCLVATAAIVAAYDPPWELPKGAIE